MDFEIPIGFDSIVVMCEIHCEKSETVQTQGSGSTAVEEMEGTMKEREKYRAEIQARLKKFETTINEIRLNQKRGKENLPKIDPVVQNLAKVNTKLSQLDQTDESVWQKYKSELDDPVSDIDKDLREALAYFG